MLQESQQAGGAASRQASRASLASSRVTGRYVSEGGVAQTWDVSVEQLLPALMRQEVEGGILLIGALGRCMQQGEWLPPQDPGVLLGCRALPGAAAGWRSSPQGHPESPEGCGGHCMQQGGAAAHRGTRGF